MTATGSSRRSTTPALTRRSKRRRRSAGARRWTSPSTTSSPSSAAPSSTSSTARHRPRAVACRGCPARSIATTLADAPPPPDPQSQASCMRLPRGLLVQAKRLGTRNPLVCPAEADTARSRPAGSSAAMRSNRGDGSARRERSRRHPSNRVSCHCLETMRSHGLGEPRLGQWTDRRRRSAHPFSLACRFRLASRLERARCTAIAPTIRTPVQMIKKSDRLKITSNRRTTT